MNSPMLIVVLRSTASSLSPGTPQFDAVEIDQIAERPDKGRSAEPGERARHGTIIDGVLHEGSLRGSLRRFFTKALNPEVLNPEGSTTCQKKVLP